MTIAITIPDWGVLFLAAMIFAKAVVEVWHCIELRRLNRHND